MTARLRSSVIASMVNTLAGTVDSAMNWFSPQ